jgi:quercetin dioxygenase-like cupin family protein
MTTFDDGADVLHAGEGKSVSFSGTFSGNRVTFVHRRAGSAYSVVEWAAAPGAPGTPPHLHRVTDEAFYVLEGTFGFRVGEHALEAPAGTFVFVPKGLEHAFWNGGTTEARLLSTVPQPVSRATSRNWPKGWRPPAMMRRRLGVCARSYRRSTT